MKKYFILILTLTMIACSSTVEKNQADKLLVENPESSNPVVSGGEKKASPFENYLSGFNSRNLPLRLTVDSIGSFLHFGPPEFASKPVKELSLSDIEKHIGKKEKEEKIHQKEESILKYYFAYTYKNSNANVVSCVIMKKHMDVRSSFILINYDLNGNLIDSIEITASYNDDDLQAEIEKSCIIKDSENILIQTRIPTNDVTVITETYKVDQTGKFILSGKSEEKVAVK